MSYSASDFTDDVLAYMLDLNLLDSEAVEQHEGDLAALADLAKEALASLSQQGAMLSARLNAVEVDRDLWMRRTNDSCKAGGKAVLQLREALAATLPYIQGGPRGVSDPVYQDAVALLRLKEETAHKG